MCVCVNAVCMHVCVCMCVSMYVCMCLHVYIMYIYGVCTYVNNDFIYYFRVLNSVNIICTISAVTRARKCAC
jgi:hypothetical protein